MDENEERKVEEAISSKKKKTHEIMRENPWIISTFVLIILVVIMLIGSFSGKLTGSTVSESKAGQAILDFANAQGADAELVDVERVGAFYKVTLLIQEQEVPVYVTRDGKYFTSSLIPLTIEEEEEPSKPTFTEEQNALIQEFSSCLSNKGMKVYYAGWCGHCHTLIDTFGGLENAGDIMIECQTADGQDGTGADLCSKENITGFPTIKINGKPYSGARTFEAFAGATGCAAPQL